jgi:SAM-dependent methyltransferase
MHQSVEYDAFADIYDIWVEGAPVTKRNLPFYVEEFLRTEGVVVELGVGNGRIAIEAARQGKPVIGVDYSAEMLRLCREQAEAAGVAHLLTLIQADFRDFVLPEPAQLIAIPFHTIGHLVTLDDKRAGLRHIYGQLAPGGRLIFDHFVFNPEAAQRHQGVGLRGEYTDATTGHDLLLWTTTLYDFEAQTMRIIAWTDELDDEGVVLRRKYRRLSFSWLEPQQPRALLEETGFQIEALYGDFDRRSFGDDSPEQVWVARRPNMRSGVKKEA